MKLYSEFTNENIYPTSLHEHTLLPNRKQLDLTQSKNILILQTLKGQVRQQINKNLKNIVYLSKFCTNLYLKLHVVRESGDNPDNYRDTPHNSNSINMLKQ